MKLNGDLNRMEIENPEEWESCFWEACEDGDIKEVQRLCSKEFDQINNLKESGEEGLIKACIKGHLNVVRFLTTSEDLKNSGHDWVSLTVGTGGFERCEGLIEACLNNHLEIVKWFMTSKDCESIREQWEGFQEEAVMGFIWACDQGNLEVVKFLLMGEEMKKAGQAWVNIHEEEDKGFRKAWMKGQKEIVKWMILDFKIQKTEVIQEWCKRYPEIEIYFKSREEQEAMLNLISKDQEVKERASAIRI